MFEQVMCGWVLVASSDDTCCCTVLKVKRANRFTRKLERTQFRPRRTRRERILPALTSWEASLEKFTAPWRRCDPRNKSHE